ncbi:MAG: U32 family peptidase, partial [Lachnospiraceae bacterium]|nr:U32 family peptidase [Lachnospiraceae bacterium]
MQKPELLSPAGDVDCFLAAIRSGADAVYLGGNFSARAYAKNFTPQELVTAIDHAHLYGRKVYMTLNTVLKDAEMDTVIDYLIPFYEAGLDGVIIQDIGLLHLLKKHFPLLPLHASTQMTITDLEGVRLLDLLGAKRVVLARELSLCEIKQIHQHIDTELECFIHGSLCYAYSGKCLFSSMLGDRSGNRGRCAQPCRLPYDDQYLLSLKDICTFRILPELIEAGITSFKIEGRMKSPDYVAGVT